MISCNHMENRIITVPSTSLNITEACTLKCKLCLAYAPYYSSFVTPSLEDFKRILKNYFMTVDVVNKFSVTGGEPLLHRDLTSILVEINKYEKQIAEELILTTNGTIEMSDDLITVLKNIPQIKVIVNKYDKLSPYADRNYEMLKCNSIKSILYDESNRYGWIDCRDHSLKLFSEEDIIKQSSQCAFFSGKKWVISRGRLYTCGRAAFRITENIIPYTDEDYLELDCKFDAENARSKVSKFLNQKFSCSCAYCDGRRDDSKQYKAAEQLLIGA